MQIRPAGPGDMGAALAVMGEAFGYALTGPSVHTVVAEQTLLDDLLLTKRAM